MHCDKKQKIAPAAMSTRSQLSRVETSEWPSFPVFTAVRVVCRECLHGGGSDDVLRLVDSFLDELSGSVTLTVPYKKSNGSLRLVQYLAVRQPKTMDSLLRRWDVDIVTGDMAVRGDLQGIKWIVGKYLPDLFLKEAVVRASSKGHLTILKWLWENCREKCGWGGIELWGAMENNHCEVVEWLRTHVTVRPECAHRAIIEAAGFGRLEILKWLFKVFGDSLNAAGELDSTLRDDNVCLWALFNGRLDMLKFLFDRGLVRELHHVFLLKGACLYGHLHVIKWFHEERKICLMARDPGRSLLQPAAARGHLDILKYVYGSYHPGIPDYVIESATSGGYLEIIQWLHSNTQAEWTSGAMDQAAGGGHLKVVQWLHENRTEGCTSKAMSKAAQNGHIKVVKWLHENRSEGCDDLAMHEAAAHGHFEIVKWLHANRHEHFNLRRTVDIIAANGHLEILQWFHENRYGRCTTAAMDKAAANGHLNIVKWLHEHHTEGCTERAMDEAATNGHLEVVKWLHLNRSEGCSTKAIDGAAGNNHLKVVKWLHVNRSLKCTPFALESLLRKSQRLDAAVFLFSEFPECRAFRLRPDCEVSSPEVVQWIHEFSPSALEGCTLKVWAWNWYMIDWLVQNGWKQTNEEYMKSYWNRM